jgi:hypothetical protein
MPLNLSCNNDDDFYEPILIKIKINKNMTGDILSNLESMNITAYNIFPDPEGTALYAKLNYFYNAKLSIELD